MKRILLTFAVLCWCVGSALGDQTNEESQLIRVLQSNAGPAEKDAACARLKFIGTARCVPALAPLLRDPQLSHSARYVLESMPLGPASAALLQALNSTSGLLQVGIIDSLAARGEPRAIAPLSRLLNATNADVAIAAAKALGQIGGSRALRSLQTASTNSTGRVRHAAAEAVLACAHRLLLLGSASQARPLFAQLYEHEASDAIRMAAYRGLILSSGNDGLKLMLDALSGPPGPGQLAALQLVHGFQAPGATAALADLLPSLAPPLQLAVVEGLVQRGDRSVVPALAGFASSAPAEVCPAILKGLGSLGDASVAGLLVQFAASAIPEQQDAARQALLELHGGDVTDALLAQLPGAAPAVQTEVVKALGERADKSVLPRLLDMAQVGPQPVRSAAFEAIGALAEEPELETLVAMVLNAKDSTNRLAAAHCLDTAYQRLVAEHGRVDTRPLAKGLAAGSVEARLVLFPICSELIAPPIRLGLRAALEEPDPTIREAAFRATCNSVDPEMLDDLVSLAHLTTNDTVRSLAIAGAVRLTLQDEPVRLASDRRLPALQDLLLSAKTPEEKSRILAGLAEVPGREALKVVEPTLDDPAVQREAAHAAVKIALTIPSAQSQDALAVLHKAAGGAPDEATQRLVQAAVQQIEARADYITDWQVAGPYRQPGRNYAALFDIVFPPETSDPKGVEWKFLRPGTDPKRPWLMDLLKTLGNQQQCVAYARTWIHSDKDLTARLELGSDDGVKAWLNDKQVYAMNVSRVLTPGSDKVNVNLHSGWNNLLLKVTQNTQGWEFCARFRNPDGSHLDGVQCDTSHATAVVQPVAASTATQVQAQASAASTQVQPQPAVAPAQVQPQGALRPTQNNQAKALPSGQVSKTGR